MSELSDINPLDLTGFSFEQAYAMLMNIHPDPMKGEPDFFFQERVQFGDFHSITLWYGLCGTMNDTLELGVFESNVPTIKAQTGCAIMPYDSTAMMLHMRMFYLIRMTGQDPQHLDTMRTMGSDIIRKQFKMSYVCPDTPATLAYLAQQAA